MPRKLGRIRWRRKHAYFRVRVGGKDQNIRLPDDPDLQVLRVRELRRRIEAAEPLRDAPKPTFTVENLVRDWLTNQVAHSRHERFAAETTRRAEVVLLPFMGSLPLDEVKASTLFAYRNHVAGLKGRRGPRISVATQRMYLGDLRAALYHGLENGMLDHSPVPRRWLPKPVKRAPDTLTREEQSTLRNMPGDYGRVLRLLLDSGMRWSECVRAQTSDLRGKRLLIRESKSGEPRPVFLSDAVAAECRTRVGRLCSFADSVSFNKRVRKLSGIERFRSHLCRHTYATEWRESGGSLAALRAALGHHDIRVTEKYGDTTEDLVERESARLEQYRMAQGEETGHKTGHVHSGNR